MKIFTKILCVLSLFFLVQHVQGQSTANYTFTTSASGSLEDMSTGTTQLVAGSSDQGVSSVTNIGFDFYFMGNRFTQFSASANGIIQLGGAVVSGFTYVASGGSVTSPKISAFGGDLQTGSSGKVHSKVIGSAPNRTLVIEFLNMNLYYASGIYSNDATYQVLMSETTGEIKFIYGTMVVSSISGSPFDYSPSVGFSSNTTANNVLSVAIATHTINTTTYTENPNSTVGTITSLSSSANGSRRVYTFTPGVAPNAPTWQSPTNVVASGMTLNWTDNASDETGYIVLRSTDNITFTQQGSVLAANSSTLNVSGLTPNTTYYWKIQAVKEGTFAEATGSQTTTGATTYTWNGSTSTSWVNALNWTPNRTVVDATDILVFDGSLTPTAAVSCDLTATQNLRRLSFINNVNVTLSSTAARTLTINGDGNSATNDFIIENGSNLTINGTSALTLNSNTSAGNKFLIAGTLTLGGTGLTAAHTITTSTSTTVITTVTGTVNLYVGGPTISGSSTSLIYDVNAIHNQYASTTSYGSIPTATWNSASFTNVLSGAATGTGTSITFGSASFGNFTWNCANQTGNVGLAATGISFGSFTVQATGATNNIRFSGSTGTVTIGTLNVNGGTLIGQSSTTTTTVVCSNYNQSGGIFDVCNSTGNTILRISNTFNQSGGTITRSTAPTNYYGTSNGSYIEFNGTSLQTPTFGTITNAVGLGINNAAGVNIGSFTVPDGANVYMTNGSFTGTLTYTNSTNKNGIIYQGTTAQIAGSELPSTIGRLTINNTAGLSINTGATLTLNDATSTATSLLLTSGIITLGANTGILISSATATLPSGSSTSFVNLAASGSFYEVTTTSSSTRNFPIGVGTTSSDFRRVILNTLNQNGTTRIQVIAGGGGTASGTGIQSLSSTRRYLFTSTGTFTSFASISIAYGTDDNLSPFTTANLRIGQSATLTGTYTNLGPATGTTSPIVSTSGTYTSLGYFALGANEIAPNIFNASVNDNWSEAGNWSNAALPTCSDNVLISSGKNCIIDVNANAKNITNNGTLNISSNTLTVGDCSSSINNSYFTNNGTLTVSGGTLNVNGNVLISAGSTFNQSGGEIIVDGNGTTSVASGTVLFNVLSNLGTVTGGKITIVDPPATGTAKSFAYGYTTSSLISWGGHTLQLGNGVSNDISTNTNGFEFDTYVSTGRLLLGNVIVDGGSGTNRWASTSSSTANGSDIGGNLTINSNAELRHVTAGTNLFNVGGNIINNGILTVSSTTPLNFRTITSSNTGYSAATNPQTISGSGVFRNATSSPTANFSNLLVNNTSTAGLTFANNTQISGTLTQTAGIINMGTNTLTIGISTATAGTWTYTAGRVIGKVAKWFSATPTTSNITFPVGDATTQRNAIVKFNTSTITTGGTLAVEFKNTDLGETGLPTTLSSQNIFNVSPSGYWTIDAGNGLALGATTYNATFDMTGFTKRGGDAITAADLADLRIVKRNSGAGTWVGGSASSTGPSNLNAVAITNQTSFSEFGLGSVTAVALPVELVSFTGTTRGNANVIAWEAAVEQNVKHYTLEKSVDANAWTAVEVVKTNKAKSYTSIDNKPFANTYYRLKITNTDESTQYSKVISVRREGRTFEVLNVSPNPTIGDLNLSIENQSEYSVTMEVVDMNGRMVNSQTYDLTKGINQITLPMSNLNAGVYYIYVRTSNEVSVHRVIKQ